eukprot:TRINITY_DN48732_c0_g1_i1.p1 TRINITY_DN48732_c0_g1~~TRINITY_DN48732_c0_g1_i1.p1  ORF type:complete len:304 (+),score=33.50 TRINITY_DN48732_c0_g1_i1:80-991(+)
MMGPLGLPQLDGMYHVAPDNGFPDVRGSLEKIICSASDHFSPNSISYSASTTSVCDTMSASGMVDNAGGDVWASSPVRRPGNRATDKRNSCKAMDTSMDEFVTQCKHMYGATLAVRNTFLEFRMPSSKLGRSASQPCMSSYVSQDSSVPVTSLMVSKGELGNDAEVDVSAPSHEPQADTCAIEENDRGDSMKTVLVRDVPCRVGCERMMAELKLLGFDGCYNFINFPIKHRRGKDSGMGYGFVNFMDETTAGRFMTQFANYRFKDICSEKEASVEYARSQFPSRCTRLSKRCCKANPHGLKAP